MKFKMKKLSSFLIAGILAIGCNNNDTTTTTDTYRDTTANVATMPDTTSHMMDTMAMATPADNTMASAPATSATTAMAKSNPAKKGKKGKVMIAAPEKSTMSAPSMAADNGGVYSNPEVMPQFPGGYAGMQRYFDNNMTYPDAATNEGIDGVVNVTFTVDENGKLVSPTVAGNKLGYGLEEEALRVVSKMPTWSPGSVKGKKVKTRFTLPVRFELE
ncbi:MAG: energy transducer TonB [Ferruginibacter sp.]